MFSPDNTDYFLLYQITKDMNGWYEKWRLSLHKIGHRWERTLKKVALEKMIQAMATQPELSLHRKQKATMQRFCHTPNEAYYLALWTDYLRLVFQVREILLQPKREAMGPSTISFRQFPEVFFLINVSLCMNSNKFVYWQSIKCPP